MPLPFRFLLQEGRVKGLEDSYEKWKKEHAEAMQALDLETMVDESIGLLSGTERFWIRTWSELNKGQPHDLEALGQWIDKVFSHVLTVVTELIEDIDRFTRTTGHGIAGTDVLKRVVREFAELHKRIQENWPWENRPWTPLNRAMQERARSEQDGPGEDISDILRRVRAGGPLVQE